MPHKCKQPLLHGAICHDIQKLILLPITYVYISSCTKSSHALRKIETNIINAANAPLNVIGRGIPTKFSWKSISKIKIKNNLPCKQRRKIVKQRPLESFDRELSGKPTVFFQDKGKF
jgi:hypothetical protein